MSPINPLSPEASGVTDTFTRPCGWGCTIHVLGGGEVRHACAGVDVLHRLASVFGVDFTDWQVDCLAIALEPRVRELAADAFTQGVREGRSGVQYVEGYEAELGVEVKPSHTDAELERILEARTTENRHLRAEVCRLKREDWHQRWVFEHAARERAEAEARRLSEQGLALLRTLESANAAAALAGDRADRAEAVQQASRIFDVPARMLVGPADADPASGDGFVEVTARALYVDEGGPA